ncbi:uncharacterized protein LOC103991071 [Musa acuminata AAA Group]|uniref:uncharacterized protein LOC103991071 n=1 Tax=Musa acuminata AAA Group TaxID=214697 RepID=UPI0031CFD7CF
MLLSRLKLRTRRNIVSAPIPGLYCLGPHVMSLFNKEPGKVVDEFKLRVTYVPAGPPSPVPEEPEEGSSTLETGFIVYKHKILYQDLASRQRRSLQRHWL